MKITYRNQPIAFNHLVPTEPLLKAAVGIHQFEDAKLLNKALGVNYSGHISFYKRATKISDEIIKKNPEIAKIVSSLQKFSDTRAKINEIRRIKAKCGESLDVIIK